MCPGLAALFALASVFLISPVDLPAQFVSGSRSAFVTVISPAVVASWRTFDNHAGVTTSLLVLWRGTPGWFGRDIAPSTSNSGATNQGFTYGEHEFTIHYDDEAATATVVKRQFSLKAVNVVLVDNVDGAAGPVIFASKWVAPGPAAIRGTIGDPAADIIMRASDLYAYLRCDLTVSDSRMNAIMPTLCGRMRGERVVPSGYPR
jgi:hypothetical protein